MASITPMLAITAPLRMPTGLVDALFQPEHMNMATTTLKNQESHSINIVKQPATRWLAKSKLMSPKFMFSVKSLRLCVWR